MGIKIKKFILAAFMSQSVWALPVSGSAKLVAVDLDLHSMQGGDPIETWRRMRPQDFIGAPTAWQAIV